jgi:hypothetical protein
VKVWKISCPIALPISNIGVSDIFLNLERHATMGRVHVHGASPSSLGLRQSPHAAAIRLAGPVKERASRTNLVAANSPASDDRGKYSAKTNIANDQDNTEERTLNNLSFQIFMYSWPY